MFCGTPQDGRFGQNRGGTFVPAKGRPFGDVQRALNATERLVLIGGDPMEQRDYAVRLSPNLTDTNPLDLRNGRYSAPSAWQFQA